MKKTMNKQSVYEYLATIPKGKVVTPSYQRLIVLILQ